MRNNLIFALILISITGCAWFEGAQDERQQDKIAEHVKAQSAKKTKSGKKTPTKQVTPAEDNAAAQ